MTIRRTWIWLTYLVFGLLLVAPLVKIVLGAWENGIQGLIDGLTRPEALHALMMTGIIVVVVTVINTGFGVMLALYLVRAQ